MSCNEGPSHYNNLKYHVVVKMATEGPEYKIKCIDFAAPGRNNYKKITLYLLDQITPTSHESIEDGKNQAAS